MSPYNYCLNNPVKHIDDDGRDVKVSIQGDTITFSSTIYIDPNGAVRDAEAKQYANKSNADWKTFSENALKDRTYTDPATKKVYQIKMEMNFVAVTDENRAEYQKVVNSKEGESGDNVILMTAIGSDNLKEGTRSNAGHGASKAYNNTFIDTYGREQTSTKPRGGSSGNMAYVAVGENGLTFIHEMLHNWGLGDRYLEKSIHTTYNVEEFRDGKLYKAYQKIQQGGTQEGFEGDMMGTGPKTKSATTVFFLRFT